MTNSASSLTVPPIAWSVPSAQTILRFGAALCFIGHGAFGFITKAAWLPYFAVAGIPESAAWQLMPWIGAIDVLAGMAVLFAPTRLPLLYMVVWAAATALVRPLSGESFFEAVERAGNYGVPLAYLLFFLATTAGAGHDAQPRIRRVLQVTTCLLLLGHGALGLLGKPLLDGHYAAIGLPPATTPIIGWIELGLAALVALRPATALLVAVAAWKLATESLFLVAGSPIWEFVERAGSYAAPLALAVMVYRRDSGQHSNRSGSDGPTRNDQAS